MNVVTFGWGPFGKKGDAPKPKEEPKSKRVYVPEDLNGPLRSAEWIAMSHQYGIHGFDASMQAAQVLLLRDLNTKVGQILAQQGQSKSDSGPSPSIH